MTFHPTAWLILISCCLVACPVQAQQFLLSAPDLPFSSKASWNQAKLDVVDAHGQVTTYIRVHDLDSADQLWLGYRHRETGRVLRWPSNHSGHLQIGRLQAGQLQFTPSRMQIQPLQSVAPKGSSTLPQAPRPSGLPDAETALSEDSDTRAFKDKQATQDEPQPDWRAYGASDYLSHVLNLPLARLPQAHAGYLACYDDHNRMWGLTQRGTRLGCLTTANPQALWWIAPAGPGMVRFQLYSDGQVWAVSAFNDGVLRLSTLAPDARQIWRIAASNQTNDGYYLGNCFYGDSYLTHLGGGNLGLSPLTNLSGQLWVLLKPAPQQVSLLQPFWRSKSRQLRPNPPLPPAEIRLFNSQRNALVVMLTPQRDRSPLETVRIQPQDSVTVTLHRDSGAQLVETFEVLRADGSWVTRELMTSLPASAIYDVSVYEEHLQSIAIDRTGTSPNPIEDVNYTPRSVGLFVLSVGHDRPDHGQVDVYTKAEAAKNPGALRPLDTRRLEKSSFDRLPSILENLAESDAAPEPEPEVRKDF
ncbi:MAG: hypothetical protein KF752_19025 [Pirellulaceae bacterium]|nr:hypothetical protein [Pirellulaceae bacterium]